MTKASVPNFKTNISKNRDKYSHISADQIKYMAELIGCDEDYVRKVLAGTRRANSSKSRSIVRAAKFLNVSIESANKIVKEFILIGEND